MVERTSNPKPTPETPEYFDYRGEAAAAGLSKDQLRSLIRVFERDYPHDVMLRELHILRAASAVRRGAVTLAQVLATGDERAA